MRKKPTYELAIKVKMESETNKQSQEFSCIIDGYMVSMNSEAWGKFKTMTEPKKASKDLVIGRIRRQWNESNACKAYSGEKENEYLKRSRAVGINKPDDFLYARW